MNEPPPDYNDSDFAFNNQLKDMKRFKDDSIEISENHLTAFAAIDKCGFEMEQLAQCLSCHQSEFLWTVNNENLHKLNFS